jgi:membrane protein implicated in regulation of membrane protease activity
MSDFKNYILKARIMMVIEIALIAFTFIIFQILENIIVGVYYILFVVTIFLWVILFILTINLYYKAKKRTRSSS